MSYYIATKNVKLAGGVAVRKGQRLSREIGERLINLRWARLVEDDRAASKPGDADQEAESATE